MKAQTLNVNMHVPCHMHCPFCIARLTYKTGVNNNGKLMAALPRALKFAGLHQIDTVLVTGIGEPTEVPEDLMDIVAAVSSSPVPIVELQTHGLNLLRDEDLLEGLKDCGLNTIAISACSMDPHKSARIMASEDTSYDYFRLILKASQMGFLVRLSLNMIADDDWKILPYWVEDLKGLGLHQLTFRQIGEPDEMGKENNRILDWIRTNAASGEQVGQVKSLVERPERLLRRLSYGASVYDYKGISTSVVTCMTDNPNPDEIRSVILQPDGHCYHSWNFRGSCLW